MSDLELYLLIGLIIACILIYFLYKNFKLPVFNAVNLINGAVKSGKTTALVYFGIRTYRRNLRRVKFENFFLKLMGKKEEPLPQLVSNIKLKCKYTPLTHDIIMRKKNINPM